MRNLNALLVFAKVAETRSFTVAAQRLGLTASAMSKSVARLEQELGVKLLQLLNQFFYFHMFLLRNAASAM
jgi:LysR family transcriptional regulator for bpeEF and oprC